MLPSYELAGYGLPVDLLLLVLGKKLQIGVLNSLRLACSSVAWAVVGCGSLYTVNSLYYRTIIVLLYLWLFAL